MGMRLMLYKDCTCCRRKPRVRLNGCALADTIACIRHMQIAWMSQAPSYENQSP